MNADELDFQVRRELYDVTIRNTVPPLARDLSRALGEDLEAVRASLTRLAEAHVIVLDGSGKIIMAAPFAGTDTLFTVQAGGRDYFANCIWDALGVATMLRSDARIATTCDDCHRPKELRVTDGALHGSGVVHFAIPARQWWDDIVFT